MSVLGSKLKNRRLSVTLLRLNRAKEELKLCSEELEILIDSEYDARIRSLVSETPLADREYQEAAKHLEVAKRAMAQAESKVRELEKKVEELNNELKEEVG
jgi:polyhydroxyalkanoate synthesis regulator phasin